jgi:hypothetical protein
LQFSLIVPLVFQAAAALPGNIKDFLILNRVVVIDEVLLPELTGKT